MIVRSYTKSDVEAAPPHGWPANSPWTLGGQWKDADGATAVYRLEKKVLGATVEKRVTIWNRQLRFADGGRRTVPFDPTFPGA